MYYLSLSIALDRVVSLFQTLNQLTKDTEQQFDLRAPFGETYNFGSKICSDQ